MRDLILYMHGGSGNRGCEAIVRSTLKILNEEEGSATIQSYAIDEDYSVHLDEICKIVSGKISTRRNSLLDLVTRSINRIFPSGVGLYYLRCSPFYRKKYANTIALSIGGDHYCVEGSLKYLALHNRRVRKSGGISVLWGCTVEPNFLLPKVIHDLKQYDVITARENITYQALKNAGVENVYLYPDPAFSLPRKQSEISNKLMKGSVIGINISPHALRYSKDSEMVIKNYVNTIKWIINNTEMSVLLIPHVMKPNNNDLDALMKLKSEIPYSDRISIVPGEMNCMELKEVISKCSVFVGARTHSTIAAYSSCVPTLVLGYSIKAIGIARDIFSTDEGYVVQTQNLNEENQLCEAFINLYNKRDEIQKHLEYIMPSYIDRSKQAAEALNKWLAEKV